MARTQSQPKTEGGENGAIPARDPTATVVRSEDASQSPPVYFESNSSVSHVQMPPKNRTIPRNVLKAKVDWRNRPVDDFYEAFGLGSDGSELVVLDTAVPQHDTGRYTIIGIIPDERKERIEYTAGSSHVEIIKRMAGRTQVSQRPLSGAHGDIWRFLRFYMGTERAVDGTPELPFGADLWDISRTRCAWVRLE